MGRDSVLFMTLLFVINAQIVILPVSIVAGYALASFVVGLIVWLLITVTVAVTAWWFLGWLT